VVYGSRYIDEVVCLEVNEDADTDPLEGSDSRYFVHHGERSEPGRRAGRHELASGERRGDPCPQEASRMRATGGATWNVIFLTQGKGEDKGAVVEYYQYDPYGRRHVFVDDQDGDAEAWGHQVLASTVDNVLGHKGRWHEPATGLIENRARHNNPRIGRWMQRDPLLRLPRAGSGLRDGVNTYVLLGGDPLLRLDSSGLQWHPGDRPPECTCWPWVRQEMNNSGWLTDLPNCPCIEADAATGCFEGDVCWIPEPPNPFHGSAQCFRAPSNDPSSDSGQQCCYNSDHRLITGGDRAGTPDKVSPNVSAQGHYEADVLPFIKCPLNQYHMARPPNNGNHCPDND